MFFFRPVFIFGVFSTSSSISLHTASEADFQVAASASRFQVTVRSLLT